MSGQNITQLSQMARNSAAAPFQGTPLTGNYSPNAHLAKQLQGMGIQNPQGLLGGGRSYQFSPLSFNGVRPYVAPVQQVPQQPASPYVINPSAMGDNA